MKHDYDVLVVGGGPVGVTTLALLGAVGLRALGIEREQNVWHTARAVHFDGESVRTLQAIGTADQALTHFQPMSSYRMENEAGETLMAFPSGAFGSQAWFDDVMFHQPEIESILRARLDAFPSVTLRSGATYESLEQDESGVTCTVVAPDGSKETIRSKWLIAADGATSTIRGQLGVTTEKLGTDDPWLVVDGLLHDINGLDGDMVFLGHHTRPALWVNLPGERCRMEFKVMPGDDSDEITTAAGVERLSRGVLPVDKFEADRIAIYTFRARVAEKWRIGNVFLAGDAAHQAPPLFGQGLCAGMRDAANLVWKLALVADGLADDSLLDTYESERRPHARSWVEQASTMATLVQTTDPEVAAGRDAHIRANPQDAAPKSPILGPGLHSGRTDEYAGVLSPQPTYDGQRRLDDEVGLRFLVACASATLDTLPPRVRAALTKDEHVVVVTDPAKVTGLLEAYDATAVVVRPDRYVLGAANSAERFEELLRLIPSLAHTLTPQSA
ncbi:bifunctional 3-(3-hydroxy-phenyl)propionate/3-hydroxycinnamic acid hydroxylase [Nocardioides sp. NBC_00368]|uniref:bifunctional 3-(3-hydroxy-phenyl)propionate/3-hydroxycinnamic acid hydroxylase n=1 Tax=Nocardioides sp. NBC_00368 TaxID=2976000 RepID=UPI002E226C34